MPWFPSGWLPPAVAAPAGSRPPTALADGDTASQPASTSRAYRITILDPAGRQPVAGLDGTEPLRAFVWDGASGPMLATPAIAWEDADSATALLTLGAPDLAGLEVQPYPLRVELDRSGSGDWEAAFDAWLEVLPETAAAGPGYQPPYLPGSYQDLIDKGGAAVRQLLTPDEGAGFARPRLEAWRYLRQVILARYRPPGGNRGGSFSATGLPGYWVGPDSPNPVIAGYLDAGQLLVTDQVREILARKALAILFDRQLDEKWSARARREHARADLLIQSLAAGIDLTGNGFSDLTINCGILNTRDI